MGKLGMWTWTVGGRATQATVDFFKGEVGGNTSSASARICYSSVGDGATSLVGSPLDICSLLVLGYSLVLGCSQTVTESPP